MTPHLAQEISVLNRSEFQFQNFFNVRLAISKPLIYFIWRVVDSLIPKSSLGNEDFALRSDEPIGYQTLASLWDRHEVTKTLISKFCQVPLSLMINISMATLSVDQLTLTLEMIDLIPRNSF